MSDVTAALQELRALLHGSEHAARQIFESKLDAQLDILFVEHDKILERVMQHLKATRFQTVDNT